MNTHRDKTQEDKSQSVANDVSQKQSSRESTFQFVDNRHETIAQRKLQEMANNSPYVQQLGAFQEMANNSPQSKQAAQLQAMADNHSAKPIQKQEIEEEELMQGKFNPIQMKDDLEEEELMQGKFKPIQKKEDNTGLPDNIKSGIENLSGLSMDDVKVHRNSEKPAQLQAHAYAQGNQIHLASGQEKHLPHEAWHVVQQKQGRVKPTIQTKGINVNDDTGLEKEADVMGTKAIQKKHYSSDALKNVSTSSKTVQAIMSVAAFQESTPAKFFKPRKTVTGIDTDLGGYRGAKTTANALTLINTITGYLAGDHDSSRKAAVRVLLARAQAEYDLLQLIGDGNANLIDILYGLVGGLTRKTQLIDLATAVTNANAARLLNLITVIGEANIYNLLASNLIPAVGVAHIPRLATMIAYSGGVAQFNTLRDVINYRHNGRGDLAEDLTTVAAGNAADFTRLADEVPKFLETGPPGALLPVVITAQGNYDAAVNDHNANTLLPGLITVLTTLRDEAIIAHTHASNLGTINAGFLTNVNNRIVAVTNKIGALGVGGINLANEIAASKNLADRVRTILNPVSQQVNNAAGAVGFVAPLNFNLNTFNASVANVDNAKTNIDAKNKERTIAGINFDHFLVRHTAHCFNFGDIKADNTQWDTTWGANSNATLSTQFATVLDNLRIAQNWLVPNTAITAQAVPAGGTAQIAGLAALNDQITIGQFFPEDNPGANNHPHSQATMQAIQNLI